MKDLFSNLKFEYGYSMLIVPIWKGNGLPSENIDQTAFLSRAAKINKKYGINYSVSETSFNMTNIIFHTNSSDLICKIKEYMTRPTSKSYSNKDYYGFDIKALFMFKCNGDILTSKTDEFNIDMKDCKFEC